MLKYLRWIFVLAPRIIHDYFSFMRPYSKKSCKLSVQEKYIPTKKLFAKVLSVMHLDIEINGLENLRKLEEEGRSFLVVSNHISDMDPLPLSCLAKKPLAFIGKSETEKYPFVGKMMKSMEGYFLDRGDLKQSLKIMVSAKTRLEKNDLSIVIFPEGHRNKEPEKDLHEFHPGSLMPAIKSNSPILPMAIYGTHRVLSSKTNYKRYPIGITILPPIMPEAYANKKSQDIAPSVREMILEEVNNLKVIDKEFIDKGYHKIPLRKGKIENRNSIENIEKIEG